MASTKEIKTHIESVKDTKKITNAMYLISSTKLRKARADLDRVRPYFDALRAEIKRIFRTVRDVESPFFYPVDHDTNPLDGTFGCLVITADKGLAGAYNQNVLKEAEKMLNRIRTPSCMLSVNTAVISSPREAFTSRRAFFIPHRTRLWTVRGKLPTSCWKSTCRAR